MISLDRTPGRYARFVALNPDIPLVRVSAVDGQTLDRDRCIAAGLITKDNLYSSGAVGSLASHAALWRRATVEDRCMHIAEDDAICRRDFIAAASAALAALGCWDIVLWGWNFDWPLTLRLAPGLGMVQVRSNEDELRAEWKDFLDVSTPPILHRLIVAAGICCYSISPKGARRLLDLSLPVTAQPAIYGKNPTIAWVNSSIDVEMSRHYAKLEAFVAWPCLAASLNVHAESTTYNPTPNI